MPGSILPDYFCLPEITIFYPIVGIVPLFFLKATRKSGYGSVLA